MRIIFFSDTHIGSNPDSPVNQKTGLPGRVQDGLDMLDTMIEFAEKESIDLAIFTGDAFHIHNPSATYLNAFSKRINALRRICPVLMVEGNHDIVKLHDKPSSLEIYNSLDVEGTVTSSTYSVYEIETKSGMVQVATLPYPTPTTALLTEKEDASQIGYAMRRFLKAKIKEMAAQIDPAYPAILAGHLTVDGTVYQGSTDNGSNFKDLSVPLDYLTDSVWDYVGLGHIHKYQMLNEHPPVVYAGSLDRITFNDENDEKGFVLVEIVDGKTEWEFIAIEARTYKTIETTIDEDDDDPTATVLEDIAQTDLEGAVVRLIVHISRDQQPLLDMNKIHRVLDEDDVYWQPVEHIDVIRRIETRLPESVFNATIPPRDLLKTYLTEIGGFDGKELKKLMSLADGIMSEVDAELEH